MKPALRLLAPVVTMTVILLMVGALLVVLGIFNENLNWDIFSPRVEAVLWGIFGSSVALGVFGVALTIVLGIWEFVKLLKGMQKEPRAQSVSLSHGLRWILYSVVFMALVVVICAFINYRIQIHRRDVFTRLASEQMAHFGSKVSSLLQPLSIPPRDHVPRKIYDLIHTLDQLSFISRATLYLPDPEDDSAMWGYTAWRDYKDKDGFARFFIAREFEKAMKAAMSGEPKLLENINRRDEFTRYFVISDGKGGSSAVLRIDGNPRENFRDYSLW